MVSNKSGVMAVFNEHPDGGQVVARMVDKPAAPKDG